MRTSAKPRTAVDGTRHTRAKTNVSSSSGAPKGRRSIDLILSREQLLEMAERNAKSMLRVSGDEAFRMLDRGELNGTVAEVEFKMLRHLLES